MTEVAVIIYEGAEELDVFGPASTFWALDVTGNHANVNLVAESPEPLRLSNGTEVRPTASFATAPKPDVVIVPGGGGEGERGRRTQQHHEPTLEYVRQAADGGAIMASVCTGTFILAGAGLLRGKRASTHWFRRQELLDFMAARGEDFELVNERVVDEGQFLSAGGVTSGIELGLHIVGRLFGDDARNGVFLAIERETPD